MTPHHTRSVAQTATIAPHLIPPLSSIRSVPSLPSLFLLVILLPLPPLFATPFPRRCAAPSAPSSLHPSHLLRFPFPASPPSIGVLRVSALFSTSPSLFVPPSSPPSPPAYPSFPPTRLTSTHFFTAFFAVCWLECRA